MVKAFLGKTYQLDKNENMEAFLNAYGVDASMKEAAAQLKPTTTLTESGGVYTQVTAAGDRKVTTSFKLGEEFDETTLDGKKAKTTVTQKSDDTLLQVQKFPDGKVVNMEKKFTADALTVTITLGNITAKRIYKAI
ncbi:fatty acid-binding protein, muscle-like [Schistocerca gregaria]|uniref:fatty acid-binding protein, muscle-like n=1 Tax=Schistocerca cancellata TaxID=274614 RepID=UPI0021198187|nr:fatty acid-binding protein, muscle-like [Schistocerca cancellata]XP_049840100.1 fatty acid-binding protein, muscle-like [Schistocerca gregaria]